MADIVGCIAPKADAVVTEATAWTEPCRIMILTDSQGRRHGRVEWLASEIDEAFVAELHQLFLVATHSVEPKTAPSVAS